jgi:hypothetical protein
MYMAGYGAPGVWPNEGPFDGVKRAGENIGDSFGGLVVDDNYWLSYFDRFSGKLPLEWQGSNVDSGGGWFADIDGEMQLVGTTGSTKRWPVCRNRARSCCWRVEAWPWYCSDGGLSPDTSVRVSEMDRFWNARRCRRLSLNRVANIERVTPSQETVVPGFLGCVEFPAIDGACDCVSLNKAIDATRSFLALSLNLARAGEVLYCRKRLER